MLTARTSWDGDTLYTVIYKQKHEELAPIEALRGGVPLRLQYIIERMLQKNPSARWAGADGLIAQLSHSVLPGDYPRWQARITRRWSAGTRSSSCAPRLRRAGHGHGSSTVRFDRSALAQLASAERSGRRGGRAQQAMERLAAERERAAATPAASAPVEPPPRRPTQPPFREHGRALLDGER
jgi:hypothetical protein